MSNEATKAAAWAKFEQGVSLLREALLVIGDDHGWKTLDDRAVETLNDLFDEYGYRLGDNSPDSRRDD